ncbi:protein CIP2A homolog L-like [Penaeus indicus]|uniref:protein CIP2A homolog L-like n=1 Tax=Penaeus indicus TaxID=29960 RepID=UPI00300D9A7B
MGSTSPQVKNFICLAYDYRRKKTDKNLSQLQRQLQILSVVSDLHSFEPTCMETLEFYVCLEQLLSSTDARSPLAWKVISLLAHICRSPTIRIALRDEIKLVPILSEYLISSKLSKDKAGKTLQLLQEISYRIKISRAEAWVLRLVPNLVEMMLDNSNGDDLLVPALTTLANLCRSNPPVLTCLRNNGTHKELIQKLLHMKNPNIDLQLLTAELLLYLELELPRLGNENTYIERILGLIFTAAIDGFAENNLSTLRLAADIFGELSSFHNLEDSIREYKNYTTSIQTLLNFLNDDSPVQSVEVLMELLFYIVDMGLSHLQKLHEDIFLKAVAWMHSERCGVPALRLIKNILILGDDSVNSAHVEDFLQAVTASLEFQEALHINHQQLHRVNTTLTLLEGLCIRDAAFRLRLTMVLTPKTFSTLLRLILAMDVSSNGSLSLTSSSLSSNGPELGGTLSRLGSDSDFTSFAAKNASVTIEELAAQSVILVLTVVKLLGSQKAEFMLEYRQMLSNPSTMSHIVRCQRSGNPEYVSRAVAVLCEGTVPSESMTSLIKAFEESNLSAHSALSADSEPSRRDGMCWSRSQAFPPSCEEKVNNMIARLKGTIDKIELKDLGLTDIMEMYEYKMTAMAHVEITLRDALAAADAQNRQTHHSMLQTRAQNDHLRSLLRTWEQKLQASQKDRTELQATISQVQNSARQLRENLVKEKTAMDRQNSKLQKEMSALRSELDARDEAIRKSQRLLSDAQNDIKNLHRQIKEEQEKYQKLQECNQKLDDELKKGRRDHDDLQKEIAKLEKAQSQMKKENSELELIISSHEKTLTEKESQLEEMTRKFTELKRIQDMIHNISAGKLM